MAEIILPPEENEETPQTPELNTDKPTVNSKVITIEFEAKKTNKVSTKDTNQQLYTTDTDAWFEFKETSLEGANGTYSAAFRNRHDGSIFQRTGDVVDGVAYYKIPHQEIRHAGAWRGQIVYTLSNGDTTSREFDYDVKGHILDGKDVREIVVEDFETLMSQLRSMKDNAEQELSGLVNTAEQNETDRQAFFDGLVDDIDELQANYQELLETGVLQTNINEKLEALEQNYAPRLNNLTAQLQHNESQRLERTGVNRKAYLTIIEDDARSDFFTKLKPVYDSFGIKCSIAINPFLIGTAGYMTWNQINQLHAEGYEILNHGWKGESPHTLTLEQMKANYELEKAKFIEHGLSNYEYYVYSGSQPLYDADLKNKIRQVYKSSYANSNTKESYIPFDTYEIKRYPMQLLPQAKQYVDFAVENSSYCVLMGHSYVPEYTATMLTDLLNHIVAKGSSLTYATAKYMIDNFNNHIETGNTGVDYFYLDGNGNVDFSVKGKSINQLYKEVDALKAIDSSFFTDKPITDYPLNSITTEKIDQPTAVKLGMVDAGIVTTVRLHNDSPSSSNAFTYQEYTRFNTSEKWVRKWNQGMNRWNLFLPYVAVALPTSTRPRYAEQGTAIYDTSIALPLWCKTRGFKANKTIIRNTAYNKWDVIYTNFANYLCVQAGTTGASDPAWPSGTGKTIQDGTVVWEWVGSDAVWIKADGTAV